MVTGNYIGAAFRQRSLSRDFNSATDGSSHVFAIPADGNPREGMFFEQHTTVPSVIGIEIDPSNATADGELILWDSKGKYRAKHSLNTRFPNGVTARILGAPNNTEFFEVIMDKLDTSTPVKFHAVQLRSNSGDADLDNMSLRAITLGWKGEVLEEKIISLYETVSDDRNDQKSIKHIKTDITISASTAMTVPFKAGGEKFTVMLYFEGVANFFG